MSLVTMAIGAAADGRYQGRPSVSVNLEQEVADGLGLFLRAGWADGRFESYEFTDIDRTLSGGVSIGGKRWGRDGDTLALSAAVNGASTQRKRFLDAGGLGILIGDDRLPRAGPEALVEGYYDAQLAKPAHAALDLQLIDNPAYNRDRGPVWSARCGCTRRVILRSILPKLCAKRPEAERRRAVDALLAEGCALGKLAIRHQGDGFLEEAGDVLPESQRWGLFREAHHSKSHCAMRSSAVWSLRCG